MRLIKVKVNYKDKDKKDKSSWNFYLELDSGSRIAIKPSFKEDFKVLSAVASDQTTPF